jgi:hypothetical protein
MNGRKPGEEKTSRVSSKGSSWQKQPDVRKVSKQLRQSPLVATHGLNRAVRVCISTAVHKNIMSSCHKDVGLHMVSTVTAMATCSKVLVLFDWSRKLHHALLGYRLVFVSMTRDMTYTLRTITPAPIL